MQRIFYTTASLLGAAGVLLGAFGAHQLREKLPADLYQTFEKGVSYQFYHVIALFLAGYFAGVIKNKFPLWAGICFIAGVLFFSGSLYLLSTRELTGLDNYNWLGPVTPLGGLCFIAGWLLLAFSFLKKN